MELSRRGLMAATAALATTACVGSRGAIAAPDTRRLHQIAAAKGMRFGSAVGAGPASSGSHRNLDYAKLLIRDCGILVAEKESADFYETVAKGRDAKFAANWVIGDYFAALNKSGQSIADFVITPALLGGLLDLIADKTVSNSLGKQVFAAMVETGKDAAAIVDERGLRQVTDTGAIAAAIDQVLAANADKVAEYRSGKDKLFGFFVGQVMKATGGKANPAALNELLRQKLAG